MMLVPPTLRRCSQTYAGSRLTPGCHQVLQFETSNGHPADKTERLLTLTSKEFLAELLAERGLRSRCPESRRYTPAPNLSVPVQVSKHCH